MLNKSKPLVSIIINCHNGENFLEDCLRSVINQTYENWEIIFWDNQSTDKSKEIIKNFSDKRIKYYYAKKFTTLYEARNLALNVATGSYISFLDTDDWWSPSKIEKQIKVFEKNKNLDVVYSNCFFFYNKTGKKKVFSKNLPEGKITQKLLNHYNIGGILTATCKRKVFGKKKFNGKYEIIGDFDFFVDLSLDSQFGLVNEPLAYYRIHDSNTSLKKIHLQIKELAEWLLINKTRNNIKNYSFDGVIFVLQTLKIKKNFLDGNKISALKEIFKPPHNFKKYKFFLLFLIPTKKVSLFIN